MPRSLRRALPVVVAGGRIAWIAGVAVSEEFKLSEESTAVVLLSAALADPRLGRVSAFLHCMRDPAIGETLVSHEDLTRRVAELGKEISADYEDRDLLMIGVLKGAVLFIADLMRHLTVPCEIDFMAISSYGSEIDSSGVVRILKDLDAPIEARDVLIVEDIIDSGLTLQYLLRNLRARNPRLARGLRPADQAGAAAGRPADPLRRLRDPQPLRDRLRARPRSEVPQPRPRCCSGGGFPLAGRRA